MIWLMVTGTSTTNEHRPRTVTVTSTDPFFSASGVCDVRIILSRLGSHD